MGVGKIARIFVETEDMEKEHSSDVRMGQKPQLELGTHVIVVSEPHVGACGRISRMDIDARGVNSRLETLPSKVEVTLYETYRRVSFIDFLG